MINLLPTDAKRELRAGRTNTLLLRYVFLTTAVVLVLCFALGGTYFYLSAEKTTAENRINENTAKEQKYTQTRKTADAFRSDLTIAKQILSKKIDYTGMIIKVGQVMPAGTVLENISLDPATVGKPITIDALATNYDTAVELRNALQSSPLFSDVHFVSVSSQTGATTSKYTQRVALSVTFKKESAK